jgi:hypothetical protein
MRRLGGTAGPGKRVSAGPGAGRFSTRARVVAGAAAALAVLAVLAAVTLAGSGHPARVQAPSGTSRVFARMLCLASSTARLCISARMPAFAVA